MKTLRKYVNRSFYGTFLITVGILTFIISIGGLFKITDLLAKGIQPGPIIKVFLSGIPYGMVYAVPVAALTAALLVFGRLSGDCEIIAMRSCGISMQRVALWLLPFAVATSLVCVYINSELIPWQHYVRWQATSQLKAESAVGLLEVGRTVSIGDDLRVFVGAIRPDGALEQIRIFDEREEGQVREIKAERGTLSDDPETGAVWLYLEDVTIDPFQFGSPGAAYSEKWRMMVSRQKKDIYIRRDKYQNFLNLFLLTRRLEGEIARLEQADHLRMRANHLRQSAYMEAETLRVAAWSALEEAQSTASQLRKRADLARSRDTANMLRRRANALESAALANETRVREKALSIEQEEASMVQLLARQATDILAASEESKMRLRERVMDMRILLNERIVLSLSPILFLYFGIPMGIRPHRRETSAGIAASLVVVFVFYIVLKVFGEFKDHPQLRPDHLVWIPGLLLLSADVYLLRRLR